MLKVLLPNAVGTRRPTDGPGDPSYADAGKAWANAGWLCALLPLILMALAAPARVAAEGAPLVREIFVPFEDISVLLEGQPERVFLMRDEYEDLLRRATRMPVEQAPRPALLLSARYDATIEGGRTTLRGSVALEVLEPGLHALALDLAGVAIQRATLDGQAAALARNEQGQPVLFVEGQGRRQLELEMFTGLVTSAAQQSLSFQVPTPPATQLHVTVPGNVEVRSGAAVAAREVDLGAGVTRFELVPQRGPLSLVMSLNNRLLLEQSVVASRGVLVAEVTQAYERLHGTFSLDVLHGAVDRFRFRLPDGFEVTSVSTALLSRWVVPEPEEGGPRVLEVLLREPTSEMVVMNVAATRNSEPADRWPAPRIGPLDVSSHVGVVGLLLEDRLDVDAIQAAGLVPIDTQVLRGALPDSVFQAEPGAPRLRPVAAYYAPQAEYELEAKFVRPPARFSVTSNLLLLLSDRQQALQAGFLLQAEVEKLFSVDIAVPPGWYVTGVSLADGGPLAMERFAGAAEEGGSRIQVRLPEGIPLGGSAQVYLHATHTSREWIDRWSQRTLEFPALKVLGATADRGAIAVHAIDDLSVRPLQVSGLTPLDEEEKTDFGFAQGSASLAYRYDEQPFGAEFTVERIEPTITARTFSFFRIEPQGLAAHYELIYDIRQAGTRQLSLTLPEATPATLSIRGLDGVQLKEFTSQTADGRRRWTVDLAERQQGQLRIAVDFQQRLDEEQLGEQPLPLVRAEEVAYQTSIVAVEGSAEFDIALAASGRSIDVGELIDADYQVGRRLLGVFELAGDAPAVAADIVRRPAYGVPAAVVERSELVTLVSTSGRCQTAARFLLRAKASYLEVLLPADPILWSATVDGKPATPQREGNSLLLSLPPSSDGTLRDVQIVFETPVAEVLLLGQIETAAPTLLVRDESEGEAYEVPVADVAWHLVLPDGHRLVRAAGTVERDDQPRRTSPLAVVGRLLYLLSGGVNPLYRASPAAPTSAALPDVMYAADAELAGEAAPQLQRQLAESYRYRDGKETEETPDMPARPQDSEPAGGLAGAEQPPAESATAPPPQAPGADSGFGRFWALQGVRSLPIALEPTGEQVRFRSLGVNPLLQVTLIRQQRLDFLGCAAALLIGLAGVSLTGATARRKAVFVVAAMALALALPLLVGGLFELDAEATFDPAFYAACLLVPYYLLAALLAWTGRKARALATRRAVAAGLLLLIPLLVAHRASAQNGLPLDPDQLLHLIQPPRPITLPADAVIIPYDAESADGIQAAEKVLVPYAQYVSLWNRAYPDRPIGVKPPPAPYAFAGASYRATLSGEEHLLLEGRIDLAVYQEQPVEIPLPLEGAVLTRATLDGKTARIRVVSAAPPAAGVTQQQQQAAANPTQPVIVVYVEGRGRQRFEFEVRLPLQRSGGWRMAQGRLPAAPSTALSLLVPLAQTEVRLSGVLDRRAYETTQDRQSIDTALGADGTFSVQWRPKVAVGQIDQTLTVQSTAVFDVQEDGQRMTWQLNLQFRQGQRETFTLIVPGDYLVERVTGENVRGWQAEADGDEQRLEITLLKQATGGESFIVHLSRHAPLGRGETAQLTAPAIAVPDAMLHQGQLAVRRSPLLEVRTLRANGLTRADATDPATAKLLELVQDLSPLGIQPGEAFRFTNMPFTLELAVQHYRSSVAAEVQSLVKIAPQETSYEARVLLDVQHRPVFQVGIDLPAELQLDAVEAPGPFEWSVTSVDNRRLLSVWLQSGRLGSFSIVLRGRLEPPASDGSLPAPRIELDVDRQQGYLVVQTDPAYEVRAEQLRNCDSVLPDRVHGWLDPGQRQLARLVLHYRSPDFSAQLVTSPRQPGVSALTITNVRVTPREIEETVFLQFAIVDAGIREVSFRLPARLRNARIMVPLLRQKSVEEVEGSPDEVRIRLELQDDVIGQLIAVVQQDRPLTSAVMQAPIPVVETGETDERYVVLESAGRDEVVVEAAEGLEELKRQQRQWDKLAGILGSRITQAYLVSGQGPRFGFRTLVRATVETAGARIRLSETLLLVDGNGAYRGRQTYYVDNKTEQFLEIRLPEDAVLWTAKVAGQPVKPTQVPDAAGDRALRIPLIKTATGDLDYPVELKYGGRLASFGSFPTVTFPLVRTANINVEQSQVRLRLPETYRWLHFGGTMRRVSEGDLVADYLAYKTKQIQDLRRVLSGSASEFSKVRARSNLKQLGLSLHHYHDAYDHFANERLEEELLANTAALQEAQREIQAGQQAGEPTTDNRDRLVLLCESQETSRSRDIVVRAGMNFLDGAVRADDQPGDEALFNFKWLAGNRLDNTRVDQLQSDLSRLAESPAQAPLTLPGKGLKLPAARPVEVQMEAVRTQELADAQEHRGELSEQVKRYESQLEQQALQLQDEAGAMADFEQHQRGGVGGGGFGGGLLAPQQAVSQLDTGLASLDVALPDRGREYLFTTPRGEIEITSRAVATPHLHRAVQLLALLGGLAVIAVLWRAIRQVNRRLKPGLRAALLIVAGCVSLLGFFPVAGLVAIAAGVYVLVQRRAA